MRVVAFVNFLSAVSVSLGQDLRRHNQENYFTPYLLTAGFASGVFTVFLAITMRRRKRAAWILNLELLNRAREIQVMQVSLNFAVFRSVFERGGRIGAGPVLRLWRSLLSFFSRWWQIESLYRANAKYRPIWEPRFLLFEKSAGLPRIGIAAARAEGFLRAPLAGRAA